MTGWNPDADVPEAVEEAKRLVRDNGVWAATLKQPHVQLITDELGSIDATGIRTFQLPGSIRVDRLELSLDGRLLLGAAAAAVASVLLMAAVASLSGIRRRFGTALRSQAGVFTFQQVHR